MSRGQRLNLLAIAVAIAVAAILLLTTGSGSEEENASTGAQATATANPGAAATAEPADTATPTPTPKPQPPLLSAGGTTKLRVKQGDTARFRVRSETPEEIHVHVYEVTKAVEPGKTANVAFKADITGIFEIELHGSGEQIGQLRVDPR